MEKYIIKADKISKLHREHQKLKGLEYAKKGQLHSLNSILEPYVCDQELTNKINKAITERIEEFEMEIEKELKRTN